MKKRKILLYLLAIILLLILTLWIIRWFTDRQIDDISPEIPCNPELVEKSDVLYVIPRFNNKNISANQSWCGQILAMQKELALHGVYHTYQEFNPDRDDGYLLQGIVEFEKCFYQSPERFKPPQLSISQSNRELVQNRMQLDHITNAIFHKVYHCNNSGFLPNNVVDWV